MSTQDEDGKIRIEIASSEKLQKQSRATDNVETLAFNGTSLEKYTTFEFKQPGTDQYVERTVSPEIARRLNEDNSLRKKGMEHMVVRIAGNILLGDILEEWLEINRIEERVVNPDALRSFMGEITGIMQDGGVTTEMFNKQQSGMGIMSIQHAMVRSLSTALLSEFVHKFILMAYTVDSEAHISQRTQKDKEMPIEERLEDETNARSMFIKRCMEHVPLETPCLKTIDEHFTFANVINSMVWCAMINPDVQKQFCEVTEEFVSDILKGIKRM